MNEKYNAEVESVFPEDRHYTSLIEDFSTVWEGLERCDTRGINVYNEQTRSFVFSSYAEISVRAGRLAGVLLEFGISRGDRVLLAAKTESCFAPLWLALVWVGAVPVPMPPRETLLGERNFYNRIKEIVPHFKYYICNDNEFDDIAEASREKPDLLTIPLSELFAREAASTAPVPERALLTMDDLAFIQFTSGSTGVPRGILIRYGNLYANIHAIWSRLWVDPSRDCFGSWLPLHHDMGLVSKLLSPIFTQTPTVLIAPQIFAKRPLLFLQTISDFKINVCSMPNFALEWILRRLEATDERSFSLESMRWFGVGAEPINSLTLTRFYEALSPYGLKEGALAPCYGLAEATLAATIPAPFENYVISERGGRRAPTVGRPAYNFEIKIGDGRENESGPIRLRGPSVATHALINGQETRIVGDDGFYDTGDEGYFDGERLVVQGRSDDMFIINGENLFPQDVEHAVREIGILRNRAACFSIQRLQTADYANDVIVLYESKKMPDEERKRMNGMIAHAVLQNTGIHLSEVLAVPPRSIPVTPSGKIKRKEARSLYLQGFYHEKD